MRRHMTGVPNPRLRPVPRLRNVWRMASTLRSMDDVRRRILDAAGSRFSQYGYGKTNVAEIAADMSPTAFSPVRLRASRNSSMPPPMSAPAASATMA